MSRINFCFIFLLRLACLQPAMSACYWRNGTQNTNSVYSPQINDTSDPLSNICCAGWDNLLPNGLCENKAEHKIWRESCTQSNWEQGGCQELCSNEDSLQRSRDEKVTPCTGASDSLTWCCGDSNRCCTDGSTLPRYTIAARFGDPIPTVTSSLVSSSTASSIVSSTVSSSPSGTPITTGDSELSTGAKAGIGIGATLGAIALIGLGVFIAKALRWRKKARDAPTPYVATEGQPSKEIYRYEKEGGETAQLASAESQLHEMPGSGRVSELDQIRGSGAISRNASAV